MVTKRVTALQLNDHTSSIRTSARVPHGAAECIAKPREDLPGRWKAPRRNKDRRPPKVRSVNLIAEDCSLSHTSIFCKTKPYKKISTIGTTKIKRKLSHLISLVDITRLDTYVTAVAYSKR